MTLKVDLHTHSNASDGTVEPRELAREAATVGITTLALTDHDTSAGLTDCAEECANLGIEFIPGCELSSTSPKFGSIDVLGLWLPWNNRKFEAVLDDIRNIRRRRNHIILQKLANMGMVITDEDLQRSGVSTVCRPHIATLLVEKGYAKSVKEVFQRFIGDGCPAYAPKELFGPAEAVELLASIGATPVLAHPMLIPAPPDELDAIVKDLTDHGLAALEVYHSEHDGRATRQALALAEKYGLALSGGSDYHGEVKPGIKLGCGKGSLVVPYWVLDRLKEMRVKVGLPV